MSNNQITQAENKWLALVEEFFNNTFDGCWMPSHDLLHHRRVWHNARKLASSIGADNTDFMEQLLLACYFHDLGLVIDKGEKHGKASRKLCGEFLMQNKVLLGFEPKNLFQAIEHHDDKEYRNTISNNLVYSILCIADDLDAFGAIGVYRYVEIYLQRGMDVETIPGKIRVNAAARFMNIKDQVYSFGIQNLSFYKGYNVLVKLFDEFSFEEPPQSLVSWLQKNVIIPQRNPFPYLKNMASSGLVPNERVTYFLSNF